MSFGKDHQHRFSDWFNSGTCQRRQCDCGQTETRDHNWGPWTDDWNDYRHKLKRQKRICHNCRQEETSG